MNELLYPLASARLVEEVRSMGLEVIYGSDFRELEARLQPIGRRLTEHFRTSINTYTPEDAFWVALEDGDGVVCGHGAARINRLGRQSLREHWQMYWPMAYNQTSGKPVSFASYQAGFADRISGNVVYFGDFWISEKLQGGSRKASRCLGLIEMFCAYNKWRPDYLYIWVSSRHGKRGSSLAWGFTHYHPMGIRWSAGPETVANDLSFAGIPAADVEDLMYQVAREW